MEQAIAFMAGSGLLLIGLSCLLRGDAWTAWLMQVRQQGERAALTIGMCELLLGGLIVGFHWQWQGLPLVLTLIGLLAMLEASMYLLFPRSLAAILGWMEPHYRIVLRVGGIVSILLAAVILCEWWQYRGF